MTPQSNTARIAELNDLARTAMGIASKLVMTQGVAALGPEACSRIREKVELHSEWGKDTNPYGERDFGAFDHDGERIYWKIDYYDRKCEYGSEDPSDPAQTTRVLTILLSSEY